jgi:hypothetical protein
MADPKEFRTALPRESNPLPIKSNGVDICTPRQENHAAMHGFDIKRLPAPRLLQASVRQPSERHPLFTINARSKEFVPE